MRKTLITLAAAASALVVATPAAAQYYNQGYYNQGYNAQYNAPYGQYDQQYGNGYGQRGGQQWAQQIRQFHYDIQRLSQQGRLTNREVRGLNRDLRVVERALYSYGNRGITRREAWDMNRRMENMRIAISRSANDADTRRNYRRY
jgi:hypothetical protein